MRLALLALRSLIAPLSARTHRDERGATAVEYGLMVALVAVAIIVAVTLLGTRLGGVFNDVADEVGGATPAPTST